LWSSSTAAGPYALDTTGVNDGNAQTVTIPVSSTQKFYKINHIGKSRITKTTRVGNNIVISYLLYFQPGF